MQFSEYDKRSLDDRKIGRKTISDELDNKPIKGVTLTEKDLRPMFVEVQVLERGQYFVSASFINNLLVAVCQYLYCMRSLNSVLLKR